MSTAKERAKRASDASLAQRIARGELMTKEQARERHKLSHVWYAMKKRCYVKSDPAYPNYGGRGIRVCQRWLEGSANLLADMGPRPNGGMLDRIDNNGNYEPSNCKWSTRKEQNSNRRNCIYVVCEGKRVTLAEACRMLGMKYRPVMKRIVHRGWDVARALSTPIGIGNTHAS